MTPPGKDNPWKAVGLVSAISADLIIFMVAGYFLGNTIAQWTGGHRIWIVIGIMAGFFLGAASVVFLIRRMTEEKDG